MNFIFDWSGTLADEKLLSFKCTQKTIQFFGGPKISREEFDEHFCLPALNFYRRYLPHTLPQEIDATFFEYYQVDSLKTKLFPGCQDLLNALAHDTSNPKLFVLSSIDKNIVQNQLKELGLLKRFEKVLQSNNKGVALKRLIEKENLIPHETYMIGDLPHDIQASKQAGIPSIAVGYGYSKPEVISLEKPDYLVQSPQALKNQLIKILQQDQLNAPIATVGGLIQNEKGEFLFVQTAKWSNKWGTPGGKIERGEPMEDAFAREIKEETGLSISNIQFEMVQDCIDHPEFYKQKHFLLINYTAKKSAGQVVLNYESSNFKWSTLLESLSLDLNEPTHRLVKHLLEKGKK